MTLPIISQTVTNDSVICLPKQYLIEAIKDIERGDECQQELLLVKSNDSILYQQIDLRDSIIFNYYQKGINYENIIKSSNEIINIKDNEINNLEKDNKKYKNQRNFVGVASIIFIGIAIIL